MEHKSGIMFEQNGFTYVAPVVDVTEVFNAGKAECVNKHFVTHIDGTGTQEIKFNCPFEPDTILIFNTNRKSKSKDVKCVAYFLYDRTAEGKTLGGMGGFFDPTNNLYTDFTGYGFSGMSNRYSRNEETGETTISGVNINKTDGDGYTGVFGEGELYTIICEKHT